MTAPAGAYTAQTSVWTGVEAGTGPGLVLSARLSGGSAARRTFSAEDWSLYKTVQFTLHRNAAATAYADTLQFWISTGSDVTSRIFRIPLVDIPEGVPTVLSFNFAYPAADPYWYGDLGGGLDETQIANVVFKLSVLDDLPLPEPDGVLHIENFAYTTAVGTDINAQVAPAAATDLANTSKEYEIDFLVREPQAVGSVTLKFSNEAPTYPAGPTAYRAITFSPQAFEDGATNSSVRFCADEVGTPTDLDDINVLRVELADEVAGGFELELYDLRASDDSSDYKAAESELIEHPADVVRHILIERVGVPAANLDATFSDAETNLGENTVSAVLGELGSDFYSILGRLGFEHRLQLVSEEAASATIYRLLTAQADYTFPTTTEAELDRWSRAREFGRGRLDFSTRFRTLFDPDRGLEVPEVSAGYRQALRVDVDVNDIEDKVTTAALATAEENYGVRSRALVALSSVTDAATAIDREGYFATELTRSTGREYLLEGVPPLQAYTYERGDIVRLTPPWLGSSIYARVIQKTRRTGAGALVFDLRVVEVNVS